MLLLSFMTIGTNVLAQKIPANNIVPKGGTYHTNADGIGMTYKGDLNNLKIDNNSFVKLTSSSVALGVLGVYPASLQFEYTTTIPKDKPYYFRLSNTSDFSGVLLGGAVGGFLGGLVFGSHWVDVTPYYNGTVVEGGGRTDNYWNQTATNNLAVMEDGNQNKYIRIVPKSQYNQIKYTDNTVLGLININSSEINYAYYNQNQTLCDIPLMTSYTGSGGLLSAGSQNPVTDAYKAIDSNLNSFASIGGGKLLDVSLGSIVEQFFYLPEATNKKILRLKMSIPSGLLNVNLADQSQIVFYKNNQQVGSIPIDSNLLGIDLAGLINANNTPLSFLAIPPLNSEGNAFIEFDKVSVKIIKPVNVNLLGGSDLRIYDVAFVDANPEIKYVCTKEEILNNIRTEKFLLTDLIPNYSVNAKYIVIDSNHNLIVDGYNIPEEEDTFSTSAENIKLPLGTYYIKGIDSPNYCPNEYASFTVRKDTQYRISGKLSVSMPLVSENSNIVDASHVFNTSDYSVVDYDDALNNVTAAYSPIQIFRESDNVNVTGIPLSFPQIGTYNFYAKTHRLNNPNCEIVRRITVYVYDQAECDYRYQKLGANTEEMKTISLLGIPLGGSSDSAKTIDSSQQEIPNLYQYDLSTHGSIFNVISLLGIGTTSQDLIFKENNGSLKQITPGTPLTIKLGQDYSVLQVLGGITIRPIDTFGQAVGPLLSVDEFDLANVLVGDNVFEFTFIPQGNSGENIWYSGVRINLGSVLGLGNTLKVYGAYIDERIAIGDSECNPNIVINGAESRVRDQNGNLVTNLDTRLLLNKSTSDVLYGTRDIGLGVATALSSILYPYHAADAIEAPGTDLHGTPNLETGTTFNASVGALNAMTLTVKFKEIARPGDKVRIVLGHEGGSVLDANVLGSELTAQRYMGSVAIGEPVTIEAGSLIDLDLLSLINPQASNKYAYMLEGIGAPFDRVELQIGNIVNAKLLAPKLVVYDMSLLPYFEFESLDETTTLCTSVPFEIEKMDPCTSYDISFSYPTLTSGQISAWNNIQGSEISIANEDIDKIQYRLQMRNILNEYNNNGTLYMKVITKRQGCIYGDPQYLKVKLASCGAIVNPMIRTRAGR